MPKSEANGQKKKARKSKLFLESTGFEKAVFLSLAELRRAACGLKAVLLTLLHAGISGQIACCLEHRSVLGVSLEQGTGDAVTDGSGLAGVTAALDINLDVELIQSLGCAERLANDNLKGLKTEVLVDICLVDRDLAGAGS